MNTAVCVDDICTKPIDELSPDEIEHWDSLSRSRPEYASPFLTPHYALAVGKARKQVCASVLYSGGRRAGYFPFQFRSSSEKLLATAERVGGEMTDCFGIVGEPGLYIEPRQLLQKARLKSILFSHLHPGQAQHGLTGLQGDTNHLIELEGSDWDRIRERRRKFAADTDRCLKLVRKELGEPDFRWHEENGTDVLNTLIQFKRKQYASTAAEDALREHWKRELLFRLAANSSCACKPVLSVLYAGDQWLASHFGLRSSTVLHYWFPVYNPAFARFSPGRLLLKSLIESAWELGIRTIDLGAGTSPAKEMVSNRELTLLRGAWYVPGFRSTAFRAWCSATWRLLDVYQNFRRNTTAKAGGMARA